jgi:sporulation protein YlmC with PRC-barrel domain
MMPWFQTAVHGRRVLRSPLQRLVGADDLLGVAVALADGEELGEVRDLMLDIQRGEIVYAIVAIGPVKGVHDHLVAIPWSSFHLRDDGELGIKLSRAMAEQRFRLRTPGMARIAQTHGLVLHPSFDV